MRWAYYRSRFSCEECTHWAEYNKNQTKNQIARMQHLRGSTSIVEAVMVQNARSKFHNYDEASQIGYRMWNFLNAIAWSNDIRASLFAFDLLRPLCVIQRQPKPIRRWHWSSIRMVSLILGEQLFKHCRRWLMGEQSSNDSSSLVRIIKMHFLN